MKLTKKLLCLALALLPAGAFADMNLKNCAYHYKQNVFDFSADGIEEIFIDSRAVVPTVLDLQVGDYFIDEDGIIQVVTNIRVNSNGDITIDSDMPNNVRDFMEMVSIPKQELEVETEDWEVKGNMYDAPEAETRTASSASSGGVLGKAIPVSKRDFTASVSVNIPLGSDFTSLMKDLNNLGVPKEASDTAKSKVKDTSGASLKLTLDVPYKKSTFTITPSVDLPYVRVFRKKTWEFWKQAFWTSENWYHQGSACLSYMIDIYSGVGFEADLIGKKGLEIPLCETPGTGVKAGLYFWPELTLMASAVVQEYVHFRDKGFFCCNLDGEYVAAVPHNFYSSHGLSFLDKAIIAAVPNSELAKFQNMGVWSGMSFDGSIVGAANLCIGPKISVGISGFTLAAITGKFGAEAKISMPVITIRNYDDPYNELASDYKSEHTKKIGAEALKDTKFSVYLKGNVNGSLIKGLISTDFWSWKSDPLIELPRDWHKFTDI